jgi:hypothetical protein
MRQPQVGSDDLVCDGEPETTITEEHAQELADWMDKLAAECTCIREDRPCERLMSGGPCDDCDHSDWEECPEESSHTENGEKPRTESAEPTRDL